MEEMTATIKAASDIMDDALLQNLNRFKEQITASGIFALENLRLDISKHAGTVIIPMKQQHMLSDISDGLVEKLKVKILYSYKTEDGTYHKTVAYSQPYPDEMYIIGMESQMYGVVEEMTVTFFDTLDVMFDWLRVNLESVQESEDVFTHLQTAPELYRVFM